MSATEHEKMVVTVKKIISTLRSFEEEDPTLDDGERIEFSKSTDSIEQTIKNYADRNKVCYKHGEGFVTSSTDGEYCMACQRES